MGRAHSEVVYASPQAMEHADKLDPVHLGSAVGDDPACRCRSPHAGGISIVVQREPYALRGGLSRDVRNSAGWSGSIAEGPSQVVEMDIGCGPMFDVVQSAHFGISICERGQSGFVCDEDHWHAAGEQSCCVYSLQDSHASG